MLANSPGADVRFSTLNGHWGLRSAFDPERTLWITAKRSTRYQSWRVHIDFHIYASPARPA